ncbi:hypothetical protein SCHPADRAFT_941860 [Schizopora paradoxa]|uniref:NTF2 domain-containing protein n=1 Tax=Schizopora paradoxa TaxID=27342 RepID=A0A0H2RIL2_9AGAM|nr:hypothetical protein SCHPADRAFT_941860 [Schizopora paradoxa]
MSKNPGGPIILPLTTYVERSLTSILKASSDDAFSTAFDDFYSKELKEITFNGKKLSREHYKQQIKAASNARNTVTFGGIVSVPLNTKENEPESGFVGVFITASFPFTVVDGAPVDRTLNSSLNITVKEDDSLKLPIGAERRRVFSVDQVSVDKTGSISFPPPPK